MKVSRKSWHYRFIHFFWQDPIWWQEPVSKFQYYFMFSFTIILFPFYILWRFFDYIDNWVNKPRQSIDFVD